MGPFLDIWTTDALNNRSPAVAYNNVHDEYLVVWYTEQDEFTWDIWARRVHGDGTLDSWFNVDNWTGGKLCEPAVAYSHVHDEYLIVYTYQYTDTDYDVLARRIDWDSPGTSARIYVDNTTLKQQHPSVAYNSQTDEYLVVYEDETTSPYAQVVARRVDASDGTVDLSSTTIATGASQYRGDPDVAYNLERNNYLVAYGYENPSTPICYIACKTASADLLSLSPERQVGGDVGFSSQAAVANGPDEYLVVWHTLDQVYGRRVAHDGIPQGPAGGFPLPTTAPAQYRREPDVSYRAGFGYLVTWDDFDGTTNDERDVYARFVLPGADQAWGSDFLIDGSPHYQAEPGVACVPFADCLVAEEYNAIAYPGGDREIRGRLVSPWGTYVPLVLRNL
jgi:hypothetical protein